MAQPKKAATNLSVRSDLVRRAKALKINLSEVLEKALEKTIRERERAAWLAENQDAIDGYNEHVEKHGLFSDTWRRF